MINEEIQHDIKVVNAFKSYGENVVINGLHMSVQSGSIYGLLGASGCGKSTLLQCILGKITLDSGFIDLKADCLRDIGYMPQELSLENVLTIKEIFVYYGTLYGMSKTEINSRIDSLATCLQLPNLNEYISSLSGGQSRKVSLAISLLHDPKLIVLDEPTVGMDPLLRHGIWEEFGNMVANKDKTIIITTHYIEEATRADCVGLMRNGVLVAEGSPQSVINQYETDSLEAAFLALCSGRDQKRIVQNDVSNIETSETHQPQKNLLAGQKNTINIIRIKAMMTKNLRVFSRDLLVMGVLTFLSLIQTLGVCLAFGDNIRGMRIVVENDEVGFAKCHGYNVSECTTDEGNNLTLSCYIMNYLSSQDYNLIEVRTDKKSESSIMKQHQSVAYLYFPQNFTDDISNYVGYNRNSYSFKSPMNAQFAIDNILLKNQVEKAIYESYQYLFEKTLSDCSKNSRSLNSPLSFHTILGKQVKSFRHSAAPLFSATGEFFLSNTIGVALMVSERLDGLLDRSMFAGVTIVEMLISLFCITTLLVSIQMFVPLILTYIVFSNPILITSSFFMFFVLLVILLWIGFFYGVLIACLSPTKWSAAGIANGLFICQLLLSGFAWPIEGQATWLRPLSKLIPTGIGGISISNLIIRGWAWNHPSIIYGTTVLTMQLISLILILIILGKIKKDMWVLVK